MALDAAWTIAESEGYRGLTVRNIAEKIGYVPGTLYNVFDNLDDLVLQLRGETLNALERLVSEAMSSPGPPEGESDSDGTELHRVCSGTSQVVECHVRAHLAGRPRRSEVVSRQD